VVVDVVVLRHGTHPLGVVVVVVVPPVVVVVEVVDVVVVVLQLLVVSVHTRFTASHDQMHVPAHL